MPITKTGSARDRNENGQNANAEKQPPQRDNRPIAKPNDRPTEKRFDNAERSHNRPNDRPFGGGDKTQLMRSAIINLRPEKADGANAGLWLERGLREIGKSENSDNGKGDHIDAICRQKPSSLYQLAYKRWSEIAADQNSFASAIGKINGRLMIGSSAGTALETSVSVSRTYGAPIIPGSAVKGCARSYAENALELAPEQIDILFGKTDEGGCLVWHDAWWIAEEKSPFVRDVVTTHHNEYYTGKATEATDFDSPIPNALIAVRGSFLFAIEGELKWRDFAMDILKKALEENGIGAKNAAGYGYMKVDASAKNAPQTPQDNTPLGIAKDKLQNLEGNELANYIFNALKTPETAADFCKLINEICAGEINGWAKLSPSRSNTTKLQAYNAYIKKCKEMQ